MKKPLKIPKFKNEDEERKFWWKLDLSEYLEPSDFEPVSPQPFNQFNHDRKSGHTAVISGKRPCEDIV